MEKPLSLDEKVSRILALESEQKNAAICDYTVNVTSYDAAAIEILEGLGLRRGKKTNKTGKY